MDFDDYQECAERTSKFRGAEFDPRTLTTPQDLDGKDRLLMAALGLAGEAGEVADLIKKVIYHGHSFDRTRAAKELGDVQWYLAEAASALGLYLEDIAETNIEKLGIRYGETGFSSAASINRKEGDT